MERIPFGVTSAMIQGGTGTYDGELRGEYPVTWRKREGDVIVKGEIIAIVDVDKTKIEIPAPCDGRIVSLLQKTTWGANGNVIAVPNEIVLAPALGEIEEIGSEASTVSGTKNTVPRLTPFAKKVAEAERIDVSRIEKGTGAGGRICAEDVRKAKKEEGPSREAPRAVPAARSYAEAQKIDLSRVKGTRPDGLILLADVQGMLWEKHREHLEPAVQMAEDALQGNVAEKNKFVKVSGVLDQEEIDETLREFAEDMHTLHGELWAEEHRGDETVPTAPMTSPVRKTIARLLARSWKEILPAGDTVTADTTVLIEFMQRYNEIAAPFSGAKLRLDYLIAWYARELLIKDEFRILNGYWDAEKEEAVYLPKVNIGIAVDTERGLVVPVLHDTGSILSFAAFIREADATVKKARHGTLGLRNVRDLTFTVNNTGKLGGENPSPIIPYAVAADGTERPTAMILSLARIRRDRKRSLLPLVFRFDHRLCDGREALAFACALRERIESKKSPEEFTAELSVVPRSRD